MLRLVQSGLIWILFGLFALADDSLYFRINIVDEATGRGVPLVELKTVNGIRYYSDSAGVVAFHEPGLMNQQVFFHIRSHGYEYPKDAFGFRGKQLKTIPGRTATLKIKRTNIAERLYRITGAGIYRDSILTELTTPTKRPVLNARVLGSDSVVNAIFKDKLYWFWGDTNRPSYPLGNFHVPGAVSNLPSNGGLDPESGVNLNYFTNAAGFAKPTARLPGEGPTWINGLVTLNDSGRERLFAAYVKIKPPLSVYERGLIEFNNEARRFENVTKFEINAPLFPHGHPIRRKEEDIEYVYFGDPFPLVRVRATVDHLCDLGKYEGYTCVEGGDANNPIVEQTDGRPTFRWRRNAEPFTQELQARLVRLGKMKPKHGLFQLKSAAGKPIIIHRGTVRWNAWRKRWIMIAVQQGGTSFLGEVWYAEADQPVGPWRNARKILTHDKYSFYNPKHHEYFDKDGGKVIFFEGTYTHSFSGHPDQTPRYDYNQIMYKLDLSDKRLR